MVIKWWDSLEIWEQDKSKPFNEHSHHNTFMMLYAFAIENYCKGVLAWHLKAGERSGFELKASSQSGYRHTTSWRS